MGHLGFDPSRTTGLRRRYAAEMGRRFLQLQKDIVRLLVTDDEFGLVERKPGIQQNARFEFLRDDEKVDAFNDWLKERVDANILSVERGFKDRPWLADYVDSAYRQGRVRGFTDVRKSDLAQSLDFYAGSKEQFLRDAFAQPETTSKLRRLYTRQFEGLKGITADMSSKLSRIFSDGVAAGNHPKTIARALVAQVEDMSRRRAKTLARTETIHAHAEAQLDSFEELGVEEVDLEAELVTAGDNRVCPQCTNAAKGRYTIQEARGLIPLHPLCRCAFKPVLGKSKKSKPEEPQTLEEVVEKTTIGTVHGTPRFNFAPTAIIRWMGSQGWNFREAQLGLNSIGFQVADSTIRVQLSAGIKGLRGPAAELDDEQQAFLRGVARKE